jgi:hypothetical protein
MPAYRTAEAWRLAEEMARSGQYSLATTVEDILSSMGYGREVDDWKGKWEEDRLGQLCRDSAEASDAQGG